MRKTLSSAATIVFGLALLAVPTTAIAQTPVPPNWSFTGAYAGLNLGAVQNIDRGTYSCYLGSVKYGIGCVLPNFGNIHAEGFLGGATLGYNWQIDRLVLGVEADYDGSSLSGGVAYSGIMAEVGGSLSGKFSASEGLSWLSTERLRLGFVTSPGSMVFLTGGAAQGEWQLQSDISSPGFGFTGGYPDVTQATRSGWAEGIGYETALAPRVSFKVDVMSYELQPFETNVGPSGTPYYGYTAGKDFYFHGSTARIGLNWKL